MTLYIILIGLFLVVPDQGAEGNEVHVFFVDSEGWKDTRGRPIMSHRFSIRSANRRLDFGQEPLDLQLLDSASRPITGDIEWIRRHEVLNIKEIQEQRVALKPTCTGPLDRCTDIQDGVERILPAARLVLKKGEIYPVEIFADAFTREPSPRMPWMASRLGFRTLNGWNPSTHTVSTSFNAVVVEVDFQDQVFLSNGTREIEIREDAGRYCRFLSVSGNRCRSLVVTNAPRVARPSQSHTFPDPEVHFELLYRLLNVDPSSWRIPHPLMHTAAALHPFSEDFSLKAFVYPPNSRCIPAVLE